MAISLPQATLERLIIIYGMLEREENAGLTHISSKELSTITGETAHTIRKDISVLLQETDEQNSSSTRGYDITQLKRILKTQLGLTVKRQACIIGLGRLGTALLHYSNQEFIEYDISAAFDSNTNRLELISTEVPLFPSYRIGEIVKAKNIEIAILAIPPKAVSDTVKRLEDGGIRGIINFTPEIITPEREDIFVRNVSLQNELRIISAQIVS